MSNKHYIKGLRRRALRRGMGRGVGQLAIFAAAVQRQDEEREKQRKIIVARAGEAARVRIKEDPLVKMIAQDQKRKAKVRRGK